jgi:cobalt-precorrin 5A hydrolase/precorrin-3B C17-methyltransferase
MAKPVILALSQAGLDVAQRAASVLDGDVHGLRGRVDSAIQFDDVSEHICKFFQKDRPIVGVCAAGILIRALSPILKDKMNEPPVIALSHDGKIAVPLLGGHRGANRLALALEESIGALAAITTASDRMLRAALDDPPPGWRLVNPEDHRSVAAALLNGAEATLTANAPEWLRKALCSDIGERITLIAAAGDDVWLSCEGGPTLKYVKTDICIGIGCARGVAAEELAQLVTKTIAAFDIAPQRICGVFSIDVKANEAGIHALAKSLNVPARFFSAAELENQKDRLATPSEIVFQAVGCHGVAEGAALAASGEDGQLRVPKRKSARATMAIAAASAPITQPVGRARGRLSVVGIGPGDPVFQTTQMRNAVTQAQEIVGYALYVSLLPASQQKKCVRSFGLGEEEARCRYALEQAGKGRDVALVCSGDGGIYAMGALVMELLDRARDNGGVSDAARCVEIINVPGISALQTASAKAGALLGHDFCAISLSDLLTPWDTIKTRLEAAARGDFVIAFYNPVSQRRRGQLAEAKRILLEHRRAETPVILATSLGRPEESLRLRSLATLAVDDVDMMTIVLVGSSQSRVFAHGDYSAGVGGSFVYTPRGYAKKMDRRE